MEKSNGKVQGESPMEKSNGKVQWKSPMEKPNAMEKVNGKI